MSNAYFVVNTSAANIFTNSLQNDIMLYSASNSQNWRMGSAINSAASFNITSNTIYTSNTLVGINNSNPAATLDVSGTSMFRSNMTFSNTTGSVTLNTLGSNFIFPAGSINSNAIYGNVGSGATVSSQWSNNGTAIGITGSNVGIGFLTPQAPLDVNGASIFRGSVTLSNTTGAVSFSNSGNLFAFPTASIPSTAISGVLSQWSNNGVNIGIIGSNVGIGNLTPGATLDVTGTVNISSNLTVGGKLTVSNVEYITSNVIVYNSEIINSNLTVCNTFTLSNSTGYMSLSNSSNYLINSGGFSNIGSMYVQSNLTVQGSLTYMSNMSVVGNLSIGNGSPISAVQPYAFYSGSNTLAASTNTTGLFGTVSKSQGILGLNYSASGSNVGTFTNTTSVAQTYAFSWTILYNTAGGSGYTAYLTDGTNNYGVSQSLSYSYVSSSAIITLPAGGSVYMILWNSVGCTSTNQMQITCLTPVVTLGTGNIVASQPYGAYSVSAVTWSNAAWTVCPFNTVVTANQMTGLVANGSGSFTNNTSAAITAVISYSLFFPPNGTNTRQAAIWDGSTNWGLVQCDPLQSSDNVNLSSSAVIQIAPGTTIQIRGYQNSGVSLTGGSGAVQIAIISQNAIIPTMIPVTYTQPVLSYSASTVSVSNNTTTTLLYTSNYMAQGNTGLTYNSGTGVFTNTSGSTVVATISAYANWTGLANAGSIRSLSITFNKSANTVINNISGTVDANTGLGNHAATTVSLSANDYFSIGVWQDTGVTTSLTSTTVQISVLGTPVMCPSTFPSSVTINSNLTIQGNMTFSNTTGVVTLNTVGSNFVFPVGSINSNAIYGNVGSGGTGTSTSSQWSNNGANIGLLGSNVGIGSLTPQAPLDITGATIHRGAVTFSNATGAVTMSNSSNVLINVGGFSNTAQAYFGSNVSIGGSLSIGGGNAITAVQPVLSYTINPFTVTNGTWYTILYNTLQISQGNTGLSYNSSTGVFTNVSGSTLVLSISYDITWYPNTSGTRSSIIRYSGTQNNATGIGFPTTTPNASITDGIVNSASIAAFVMNANDTFYVQAIQDSGSTITGNQACIQIATLNPNVTLGAGNITATQSILSYFLPSSPSPISAPNATNTTLIFSSNMPAQTVGNTGLTYNSTNGRFTNSTSQAIVINASFQIVWSNSATAGRGYVGSISLNGLTSYGVNVITNPTDGSCPEISSSATILMQPNDYIYVTGTQTSGSTLSMCGNITITTLGNNVLTPAMIPVTYTQPVLSYAVNTVSVPNNTGVTIVYSTQYGSQGNTGLSYNASTGVFTNTSGSTIVAIISAGAVWAGLNAAGSGRQFSFTFNKTVNNVSNTMSGTSDASSGLNNALTTTVVLAANDYFSVGVWQNSGSTTSLQSSSIQISVLGAPVMSPSTFPAPVTMNSNLSVTSGNLAITGASNTYGYPADPTGNTGMLSAGNLGMFRNRIINGNMAINQRGGASGVAGTTGTSIAASGYTYNYPTIDRWGFSTNFSGGPLSTLQLALVSTDAPFIYAGLKYSLRLTATAAITTTYIVPMQTVESYNMSDFNWSGTSQGSSVTLSFWFRASATGTYNYVLRNAQSSIQAYVGVFTVAAAGAWAYYSFVVPPPTGTGAGWNLNNNGAGINLYIAPISTTNIVTANTWTTPGTDGTVTSGTVAWASTSGGYVEFTGVQLEKGIQATPYEFRPYQIELQLCQRYFVRYSNNATITQRYLCTVSLTGGSSCLATLTMPVSLRTISSLILRDLNGGYANTGSSLSVTNNELYIYNGTNIYISAISNAPLNSGVDQANIVCLSITTSTGTTVGQTGILIVNGANTFFAIDAEL